MNETDIMEVFKETAFALSGHLCLTKICQQDDTPKVLITPYISFGHFYTEGNISYESDKIQVMHHIMKLHYDGSKWCVMYPLGQTLPVNYYPSFEEAINFIKTQIEKYRHDKKTINT